MNTKQKKLSKTQINFLVDLGIFLLVLLVAAPKTTGMAIHEWLSIAFAVPIMAHLVLHWKWIVNVTKKIFSKIPGETRFNYILNLLIFISIVLVSLSGILISEEALPALGIAMAIDPFWSSMHDLSANLFIVMTGVHIAMHWTWIVNAFKRYVLPKKAAVNVATANGGD
ncbi:MAG: DUF4405 domain-containing protein [Chloroflexi bacterium]|nr:MAG: DUF4405 domain-containing protein [Chloroflexota bacterium]